MPIILGLLCILVLVGVVVAIFILAAVGARNSSRTRTRFSNTPELDMPPRSEPQRPNFQRKKYLLSIAERKFFMVLIEVVGSRSRVFCKVRLADLVYQPKGSQKRQAWANRTNQKHVDFVLCTPNELSPFLVIELDDSSHDALHAREGDDVKDEVLRSAGLPLLRVKVRQTYNVTSLAEAIYGPRPVARPSTKAQRRPH